MSTPEDTKLQLRAQYSSSAPVRAPDLRNHTRLAKQAKVQDFKNGIEARTNPNARSFSKVIGIGTEAVYSTLPANAGRLNESQSFTVHGENQVNIQLLRYVVPAGRVLYINAYNAFIYGSSSGGSGGISNVIPSTPFSLTISVDGSADPWNQNIQCQALGGEAPTLIIAGGGQVVRVLGTFDYSPGLYVYGKMLIRGDMLIGNHNAVPYTALYPKDGDKNHE